MKRWMIWIALGALVVLTVWKLASNKRIVQERVYRHDKSAPVHVGVDTVRQALLGEGTRYSGTVEAMHDGRVMAEVPGRVVALDVIEGEWVERGAVIARLDGELLRLQLEAAQVQVGGLEKDHARYTILAKADAVQAVQLEKTDVALEAARIQRDNLNEQLRRTTIVAPFSGQVVQLLVEVGTVLAPSMPVAQLTDHRALELVLLVPASDRGRFRIGDALTVAASGTKSLVGTVSSVGDRGDGAHNFAVRIALASSVDDAIRPGTSASVQAPRKEEVPGAVIPANALIGSTLEPEVYVVQDGIAQRRTIVTTATSGGFVAVAEGLKPGEIVVTSGFISLADGMPVRYR